MRAKAWTPTETFEGLQPVTTFAELKARIAHRQNLPKHGVDIDMEDALLGLRGVPTPAESFLGALGLLDLRNGKRVVTANGAAVLADAEAQGAFRPRRRLARRGARA